jgi:membrane-associated protein
MGSMFNVDTIVQSGGLLAIGFIIFAESGLLIGFFLPGDTLLFAAGVLAGQHKLSLAALLPTVIISAIIGYQVGYKIGEKAGPRVFTRSEGLFFNKEYIEKSETFFEHHGGKAIVLARFVAIVRTFVSVVAGASKMDARRYFLYNVIGAVLWGTSVTLLGFWLGNTIPNVDRYILPVVGAAIVLTAVGPMFHILRQPKIRSRIRKKIFRN